MKNVVVIGLILACLGANWLSSGAMRSDARGAQHSKDRLGAVSQEFCLARLADQAGKLLSFKAILSYASSVAYGEFLDWRTLGCGISRPPLLCITLQSQHVLMRL